MINYSLIPIKNGRNQAIKALKDPMEASLNYKNITPADSKSNAIPVEIESIKIHSIVHLKDLGVYTIDSGHDIDEIWGWAGTDYCTGVSISPYWLKHLGFSFNESTDRYEMEIYNLGTIEYYGGFVSINGTWIQTHAVHLLQNLITVLKSK